MVLTQTYAQAAASALAAAMADDERIVVLGEDLGRGGVFGQYRVAVPASDVAGSGAAA